MTRLLAFVFLVTAATACDPSQIRAIQVAPRTAQAPDSDAAGALALVERIATRHGLTVVRLARRDDYGWSSCFARSALVVCGKVRAAEAQVQIREAPRLSPAGLRLRSEMLDSLRARFDASRVRECRWTDKRDLRDSGCPPFAP